MQSKIESISRCIIFLILFLLTPKLLAQQTEEVISEREITIERSYEAGEMNADKVDILPPVEDTQGVKTAIQYETTGVVLPNDPLKSKLGRIDLGTPFLKSPLGYVKLGYGTGGNVEGAFIYQWNASKSDFWTLDAATTGVNAKLKSKLLDQQVQSRYYQSHLKLGYTHLFQNLTLTGKLKGQLTNFNYNSPYFATAQTDKQTHQQISTTWGIATTKLNQLLQVKANASYELFEKQHPFAYLQNQSSIQEHHVTVNGTMYAPFSENNEVGVAFDLHHFNYQNINFESINSLCVNPYYQYRAPNSLIRLGFKIDATHELKFAPDLLAQYSFQKRYTVYAKATGGSTIYGFENSAKANRYLAANQQNEDSFTQLNLQMGLQATPVDGFWFHAFGGYKMIQNDLFVINQTAVSDQNVRFHSVNGVHYDSKCFQIGGELNYQYKNMVEANLKITKNSWNVEDRAVLIDNQPSVGIQSEAFLKPTVETQMRLLIHVSKQIDVVTTYSYQAGMPANDEFKALKLKDMHLLNWEATYFLTNRFSIFGKINNLLNQQLEYTYSFPNQRINALGGISFRF